MARVLLSLDCLDETWPQKFRDARVGALLHPASVSSRLEHAAEILERGDGEFWRLRALFGPQHGYLGQTQDNMVEWKSYEHPRLGIPVHSLYGDHREPTASMLNDIDVLLIDLQDVGARYYTFIWTMFLCLRAAEQNNLPVVVLDRPNPINGVLTEGPKLDPRYRSFVGLHPLQIRHGRTIGELAVLFREEAFPRCSLIVLPLKGWNREMWFDETGLPWVMPSPNMPTIHTAMVYPGACLLEGTNISEGRGTTRPFELFGAPFIDAEVIASELNRLQLSGVHFRAAWFQPAFQKFAGEMCGGAQLHVTDRNRFQPFQTGLDIIRTIRRLYPESFAWRQPPYEYEFERLPIEVLLGGPVAEFFP